MSVLNDPLLARQWHLEAINVFPVWDDYSGAGVRVGVVDNGVQSSHPDLDQNYDPRFQFNYRDGRAGGAPITANDNHGTAVAGLIAAEGGNGIGGAGVAFGASLTSLQLISTTVGREADVFRDAVGFDILNNSWGYTAINRPAPFFDDFLNDPVFAEVGAALESLVSDGRGGLGSVVVFAAGNGFQLDDNVNYHNLANSRFTIAVAGSDQAGNVTFYSTPGAALLVTAPGGLGDIVTTDRTGAAGYTSGNFMFNFAGTSAAAPIVSGVVALMLEANPGLGYRDVQEILAYSARQSGGAVGWRLNQADNWNGGGLHVSHDFGFGLVDAHAAVRLAETWSGGATHANEVAVSASARFQGGLPIPDLGTLSVSLNLAAIEVDHVEVVLDLRHSFVQDLVVTLTSPDGTPSVLLDRPPVLGNFDGSFQLDTTRAWGEDSGGTWTLTIDDQATPDGGALFGWDLVAYGDPVTNDDVYVFTDEYARYEGNAHRSLLTDPSGEDEINAAAVTGDLSIDLRAGVDSQIAGQRLTIGQGTRIEDAIGGDGDDLLAGNAGANTLRGQRGTDRLAGRNGDDLLYGGTGDDLLAGGPGRDGLRGGLDDDTLSGGRDDDRMHGGPGNDDLAGGRGNDLLRGGAGDDVLHGGLGQDDLAGGPGRDAFRYTNLGQRGDLITDFTLGPEGDRLLIGDLLIGYVDGVSAAGDFVSLGRSGGATLVRVDPDGQGPDIGLVTLAGSAPVSLDSLIANGNLVLTTTSV